MADEKEIIVLKGQQAIDLWLKGKDAWNAWVEKNPVADVSFQGQRFTHNLNNQNIPSEKYPFAGFNFPDGKTDFSNSQFERENVYFTGVNFGNGEVSFYRAKFLKNVFFDATMFKSGIVLFTGAQFGTGNTSFHAARFGDCKVFFNFTKFGSGMIDFRELSLGTSEFTFENSDFNGRAIFSDLNNTGKISALSFRRSAFEKSFEISSKESFGIVVDMVGTRTTHQVSLEGLECTVQTENGSSFAEAGAWLKKIRVIDPSDIERLRRLKELAENNRDHRKAIDFHVMEMQAARWHESSIADLLFEFLYQVSSDYGRSEFRTLLSMVICWLGFGFLYSDRATKVLGLWDTVTAALKLSGGQMFPFIPNSSNVREIGAMALYGSEQLPGWLFLGAFAQSLISIVLLFLLGLALRNRFRV